MKLIISGGSLAVTIESESNLTTEQVVMAHQLATGDYQALFVKEEECEQEFTRDSSEKVAEKIKEIIDEESKRFVESDELIDAGEWVDVELMCPICGKTGKIHTKWGNRYTKCPRCKQKLFNKFATGVKGEMNSYGCHYIADELMKFRGEKDEFEEMFEKDGEGAV